MLRNWKFWVRKARSKVPFPPPTRHTSHTYIRYSESSRSLLSYTAFMATTYKKNQSQMYICAFNILKFLSHSSTGHHCKVLLPLYQSLIHSMLDYGAPIYGLALPSQLAHLDSSECRYLHVDRCLSNEPILQLVHWCRSISSPLLGSGTLYQSPIIDHPISAHLSS